MLILFIELTANKFSDGLSGIFWLFLNWGRYGQNWKKMLLTCLNLVIVVIGGCLVSIPNKDVSNVNLICEQCGMGLWVSGKAIHEDSSNASFSCADSS